MRALLTSALSLMALSALAVPAKPGIHTYVQPDGSTVQVQLVGDEWGRYYLTPEGQILLPDEQGRLTPTELDAMTLQRRFAARKRIPSELVTDYPTIGSPKALVLLVEFQDVKFSVENPAQAFNDLLNKPGYDYNGATGSALDYYRDNSMGRFTPDFQVYGPVTLPETEPYYGNSSASLYDMQGWLMARDGVIALHETYPDLDFSQFDNNGDGFVDNVFIFYAGYGENEGAPDWTIWPHAAQLWDMYNIDVTFNGVKVNKYACTNELQGTRGQTLTGIGTFVHEFSHILGLMDIYPTLLSSASRDVSPGSWCVMDLGSYNNSGNTPPLLNAFERYILGWLNPRKLTGPENVTLEPLATGNAAVVIETEREGEFYIFENRRQTGWDAGTGGHGMLAWHIDYDRQTWADNHINNEFSHQRVDLVEADGVYGEETRSGDPFPGAGSVRSFTADTRPAMSTWIGETLDMPITDIYEIDGQITFRVKGGGDALAIPEALEATDVTPTAFTANWSLVSGISDYEVDVFKGESGVPFLTQKVSSKTSLAVSGLTPETDYAYLVRSCHDGRQSANSNRITVTTLPPSIDMLAPIALDATDISATSFVANWEPLDGATGYRLSVYRKQLIDPQVETVDFTGGISLPEGWSTNVASTGSVSGYWGESAPSLRMTYDGDRLTTAAYSGGINSLSFWYRGNSTDAEASLTVESLKDGQWTAIHTIQPLIKTEGTNVTLNTSDQCLRIVFHKGQKGSLYLDDIRLEHDASFTPIYHLEAQDCGMATGYEVTGLEPLTRYYYMVKAEGSLWSDEISVMTADESALREIAEGAWQIVGNKVIVSTDKNVNICNLQGVVLYDGMAPTAITLPAGIYVLTVGTERFKISMR